MGISQFGKIMRIDIKSVCAAGQAAIGVKLTNLDADDKVAAAMALPQEEPYGEWGAAAVASLLGLM